MSRQLIESILSNNMLEANDMVEAKMAEIRERKMYEMKRMYAAESVGGLTKAEVEARKKAGYKKASDVLGDPRDKDKSRLNPTAKIIKKKVSESVEVKPDPEGRVRGGEAKAGKPVKGTLKRKAAAAAIKGVRKTANIVGAVAGKAAVGASRAKAAYDIIKSKRAAAKQTDTDYAKAAGAEPSHPKPEEKKEKRPGMIKRLGKKIADHEPAAPGSGVVNAAKRFAGSPVFKDLADIGFKHL